MFLQGIGFQHLITGQPAFQQYIKSYMELFSKFVVHSKSTSSEVDIELLGYRESEKDKPQAFIKISKLIFTGKRWVWIFSKNVDKITRAIRKTRLQLNRKDDLKIWQQVLRWTNISEPTKKPADFINLQYSIGAHITESDMDGIIEEYKEILKDNGMTMDLNPRRSEKLIGWSMPLLGELSWTLKGWWSV